ncbi:MAG: hypothetical protein KJ950_11810 [Proteobacteria bacterium]|nr:hypothetical protein [Pseudomonadota bacterium]MBU1688027.1 hypothetical protein [Pseudomonadota bacterium]
MTTIPQQSLGELTGQILLLMKYATPEGERPELTKVLNRYEGDRIALHVFHHFYSYLPEGVDDGIRELRLIRKRQGTFLFCAISLLKEYIYLATGESAEFLGPLQEGIWDEDVLVFFGWQDRDSFLKECNRSESHPIHESVEANLELCPVCGANDGELHTLGCPVEVCPWCQGQLTRCECRFRVIGKDQLKEERHLEELQAALNAKGRIPFSPSSQRPGFLNKLP